jgi:hypothetical protein
MVIVSVRDVDSPHVLTRVVERPARKDCYAECSCGYKGPSREVSDRLPNGRREAEADFQTHVDVEEGKGNNGPRCITEVYSRGRSVHRHSEDPVKKWGEWARSAIAANGHASCTFGNGPPIPISGFEISHSADVEAQADQIFSLKKAVIDGTVPVLIPRSARRPRP